MSEAALMKTVDTDDIDYMELDDIIVKDFGQDKENLIMILQAIQKRYNYLPKPALNYLASKINIPISQIYGVATYYSTFSMKPRGRNIISTCRGTACHVRGAEKIREKIEKALGVSEGETTPDDSFTLETVRCLGGCSLGPMIKINDDMYGRLSSDQIKKILDKYK
ncbi:MAG: NADH-quinone oxidoreductase subunit NuoE [Dissulfuribacterales bacterium]